MHEVKNSDGTLRMLMEQVVPKDKAHAMMEEFRSTVELGVWDD